MDTKKIWEIVDKNVNQEQLGKDLAMELLVPKLDEIKAKVQSGEIDLIKGTDLDAFAIMTVIDKLKAVIAGQV